MCASLMFIVLYDIILLYIQHTRMLWWNVFASYKVLLRLNELLFTSWNHKEVDANLWQTCIDSCFPEYVFALNWWWHSVNKHWCFFIGTTVNQQCNVYKRKSWLRLVHFIVVKIHNTNELKTCDVRHSFRLEHKNIYKRSMYMSWA